MGGFDSTRERGQRGILFMSINPTHILIIVYNLLFVVECVESQSFNM
jgi:hypothetical protein